MLLGVDVGGTFTDAVLLSEDWTLYTAKVPTTPQHESIAVLEAVRVVLSRAGARAEQVERFAHGMTVATNALLEGRTARTALLATAGFTDVLELGRQNRPHLYRLCEASAATTGRGGAALCGAGANGAGGNASRARAALRARVGRATRARAP